MRRRTFATLFALVLTSAGAASAEAPAEPGHEAGGRDAATPPAPTGAPAFAKHAVYAELGGAAGAYSLNYERHLLPSLSARIGGMFIPVSASAGEASGRVTWTSIPLAVSYTGLRFGPHALELGAGAVPMHLSGRATLFGFTLEASGVFLGGTATLGYRYSSPEGGLVFRAGFTPIAMQGFVLPWGGTSVGFRF